MTYLDLALLLAVFAAGGAALRLWEHRRGLHAAVHTVAAFGHGRRSRPISRPRPFRQGHAGRHVKPRKAVAA